MALKKFLEKKDTLEINILLFLFFSFKTLLKGAKVRDGSIGDVLIWNKLHKRWEESDLSDKTYRSEKKKNLFKS